jgi:hypothetical protein
MIHNLPVFVGLIFHIFHLTNLKKKYAKLWQVKNLKKEVGKI